jgi:AcrR family transcriptional regulator
MLSNCIAPVLAVWQGCGVTSDSSPRRIGSEDSKTRIRLLDAAELLLLEEGYAAVTSRRVAARAGLKPQLVHYYFRTMDDLFLDVFRRRAEDNVARAERAIAADGSLRVLWNLNADPRGARFNIEFVALANHRKAIRTEIARYAERRGHRRPRHHALVHRGDNRSGRIVVCGRPLPGVESKGQPGGGSDQGSEELSVRMLSVKSSA